MNANLFEQLGGYPAVDAVVETFYRAVLTDERILHFFDDVDMEQQIAKQKAFLAMAFGGPVRYSGKAMRAAHAPLVARGMREMHFDAVVEVLAAALRAHGVKDDLIGQVAGVAESVRKDVLNQ